MTGPAGDLNRCTSGLICTCRVDEFLSVTDNLEINLTDYLLITGHDPFQFEIFLKCWQLAHTCFTFFPTPVSTFQLDTFSALCGISHTIHMCFTLFLPHLNNNGGGVARQ